MIILDTNVLSALMRHSADPTRAVEWLDKQARTSIWTTAITILEIRFGLQILQDGKRGAALMRAFDEVIRDKIQGRIAPFDRVAAQYAGDLMSSRHKKGKTVELRDTMIAGIVLAHRAMIATRNTSHFDDLAVPAINPWTA